MRTHPMMNDGPPVEDAKEGSGIFDCDLDSMDKLRAGRRRAVLEEMGLWVMKCPCHRL
jgi:hypothetical protein